MLKLHEIKLAVDKGLTVCWSNEGYKVIKDSLGSYLINCTHNNYCVGLTDTWGEMHEDESQFFILENGEVTTC